MRGSGLWLVRIMWTALVAVLLVPPIHAVHSGTIRKPSDFISTTNNSVVLESDPLYESQQSTFRHAIDSGTYPITRSLTVHDEDQDDDTTTTITAITITDPKNPLYFYYKHGYYEEVSHTQQAASMRAHRLWHRKQRGILGWKYTTSMALLISWTTALQVHAS
jgi:hypothetical protein